MTSGIGNQQKGANQIRWEVMPPLLVVAGTGVLGVVFYGLAIALRPTGFFPWLLVFFTSPGAGGLAAVVAATIGFVAIDRQLGHNRVVQSDVRAAQSDVRLAQADDSWWKSFEWATTRALPMDADQRRLPYSLSIATLTPLTAGAASEAQKLACSGFVDHIVALQRDEALLPGAATGPAEGDGRSESAEYMALKAYSQATRGTAANSLNAEARLFELDVLAALGRMSSVVQPTVENAGPTYRDYDVLVQAPSGPLLGIETRYLGSRPRATVLPALRRSAARFSRTWDPEFPKPSVLFIVSQPMDELPEMDYLRGQHVGVVAWATSADDLKLLEAIHELSASATEPNS